MSTETSFCASAYPGAVTTTVKSPRPITTNSATPREASRWPLGTTPRKSFTVAGEERGVPEASCTVTVITSPLPMNSFSWLPTSWADSEELSNKLGNIARRNGVRNPPTDLLLCMRPEAEATAHDHPRRGGASLAFCNKRVKQNIGVVRVVHQHEKLKGKEESSGLRCNDGYESWAKAAARRCTAKRGGTDLKAGHYKCEGRRLRL